MGVIPAWAKVSVGWMARACAVVRALAGCVGGAGALLVLPVPCWCLRRHCLVTSVIPHPWHGAAVPAWTMVCPAAPATAWLGLAVPAAE